MKRLPNGPLLLSITILLATAVSCDNEAGQTDKTVDSPAPTETATVESDADADQSSDATTAETKKTLCDIITKDDIAGITGTQYTTVNSTANFSSIKHCEYRSEDIKHHISLAVSFGSTANQIMETNKRYPKLKPVDGFGEVAIWESVQGTLTVLSKKRCFDVKVSQAHGDNATRLKIAKEIATLAMERM